MVDLCNRILKELRPEVLGISNLTRATKKEHGFSICEVGNEYKSGAVCKGSKCHLRIQDCGGRKQVGTVHSHPTAGDELVDAFSGADYENNFRANMKFVCLIHDAKLRCTHMPRSAEETKQFRSGWTNLDLWRRRYEIEAHLTQKRVNRADADERTRLFKEWIGKEKEQFREARKLSRLTEIEPCERDIK